MYFKSVVSSLKFRSLWLLCLFPLLACRPEVGDPDYSSQETFDFEAEESVVVSLPGPDPFVQGEQRLSLGIFYEGASSQEILVDEVTRHFYIYANEATSLLTFSQSTSDERLEGLRADSIEHSGGPWWGGGIHWDVAQDLSSWSSLHISLKSNDPAFSDVDLAMESGDSVAQVQAADYGYVNDGAWHNITVPLSDFTDQGVSLDGVTIPLRFGGFSGMSGELLLLDNVYIKP